MATAPLPTRSWTYRLIRGLSALLLVGVVVAGFLGAIPRLNIIEESARNLYFHVPMWFGLMAATLVSAYHSLRYLQTQAPLRDVRAREAARVGLVLGLLGITTGMVWARFTWYAGTNLWWNFDPKQSMAAVLLLIYGAYFVLRDSIEAEEKRGRIAAVYNLLAFVTMPFLLYIIPRQMVSLHPGAEGSPAFSQTDLAPSMRWVFYPSVLAFMGLAWCLYTQRVRLAWLKLTLRHDPLR
ncbi:cytochrome c biogenesis protein CcsA [Salisaeta longa]|uniref:cytochrome c biogenesis protein CcsA n=1 Tax=Salisaeta longa TaxID=503170 RepID=UPI0003F6EE61|nr:cytochrome c biogenesis protein CcsA [Salisaeta longa]